MDPDQPPTSQPNEMVLAKFETLPNEENMEMEVGQHMEEQVLGYLEVQPSQLQAVQEGGTIYFQSDGLELDEQLILAQGGEGGEIIVVVRTDQDGGMSFTGEGGESALRAVKFGDLAGLAQQMGLAPGTKISLQSDDKDDESGTTYLTYETTGEEYAQQMQETLQTTEMGIPGSEGNETITLSLSDDNTVSVLSVGDESLSKNTYLQEHGEMTEIPVSVSEDGTLTPLRIIEKPSDGSISEESGTIMHIVDNVSEEVARENSDQCFIAVGVNGEEINNVESYNATLAQVVEQERRINSPSKHPIVVRLPSAAEMAKGTKTTAQSDSQTTSAELMEHEPTDQLVTSNGENQLYQTTVVTDENGQQQVEYHLVQASDINGDGESIIQPAISEAECYGQWSAMDTTSQSLVNEQAKCAERVSNTVNDITDSSKKSEELNQDVFVSKALTEIVQPAEMEDPPINETLRSIEEFLRTGETGDSDDDRSKVDSKTLLAEKKKKTESKESLAIVETQSEENLPADTIENNQETIQHMVMEELGDNTTSYVVIDIDNAPEFASAMGNNIQMESVNFKSVVNEHGQSVGILETANGDLEVILDSESLVPSTNASFTKVNHDDEMSAISNHTSAVNEAIAPQLQKTFQKFLSAPEKRPQASLESASYQLNLSSTKSKVNSKSQHDGEFSKRGGGYEKPSKPLKETVKEKKATIFDVGASTEDFKVKIPTKSRTYSRKKTTPPPVSPSSSVNKEPPQMTLAGNEFSRNEIILVIEPNEDIAREYERIDLNKSDICHQSVNIDPSKMEIVIESVEPNKDDKINFETNIVDGKQEEETLEKESDLPKPIENEAIPEEKEVVEKDSVLEVLKTDANETQDILKETENSIADESLTVSISEDVKEGDSLVPCEELQEIEESSSLTKEVIPEIQGSLEDSNPEPVVTTEDSLVATSQEISPEDKIYTQGNEDTSQDSLTNATQEETLSSPIPEEAPTMKPIMSTPLETVVEDPGEIMELQEPSKPEEIPDDIFNAPNDAAILPEESLTLPQDIIDEPKETVPEDPEEKAEDQEEKAFTIPEEPIVEESQKSPKEQEEPVDAALGVAGSPQETGSLPEEDVFTPLEPVAIPDEDIPIPHHITEPFEADTESQIASTPKEPSLAKESLEKEFIAIAKKSVAVAKKSLPIPIAKKSVAVRKTRTRKKDPVKDSIDVSNEDSENDKAQSEVDRMESEIENEIQDSFLSADKSISADEENSQFGLNHEESMNYDDEIMKGSVVLDDSQLGSIKILTKEMDGKNRKSRKRQSDSEMEKETKRARLIEPRQKASTSESVTIIKEKNIKRKLFTPGSKKLGRPKKTSGSGKAYQSQDELFDELLKDSLPSTVKKRKLDGKTKNTSADSKRRRTMPARLPNDYASSDDDVVLSSMFRYPEKKFKAMGQGKRGRGRKAKVFHNRGSSDDEEVMMSNLRIYPDTFSEPSSKKGRGRGKGSKTGSSSNYAKYHLEDKGRLTKSDPSKRGRGRPRGSSTYVRRKGNLGHRSPTKKQKECKIHYCYQQSNSEKSHQIYTCKECHFRTARMANIIRHYKDCSLDMFPFKSTSLGERTPTRFKLDAASGSKSLPENRIFRRLETPKKLSPMKNDKSSKSNKARRPDDPNASRDENSIGTDDQEISDSTLDSDEGDSYDIEMKNTFGFAENDVVWAEWRNQHWPALVRKIYPRQKKVSIFFIATPMPSKGFSMHVRKITNFDDAAKNKDFLEKGFSLQNNNDQLVKAVQLAEDYLRKKCLGLKMSALQFFNDPEAAKQILSELEESAENPGSDHSDSHLNDPLTPIAIIDLDRLTNPVGEEMGDLVGETVDERSKTDEEDEVEAAKMMKFIMDGNADEHLIQVYKEDVKSERHRLFNSSLDSDRDCVKRASIYKGIIKDEIKKVELTQYCMDLFKTKLTPVDNFDVVAYAYEVMATEAILKAISLLSNVTLKQAEEIFVKDDLDKTQCIFVANNKTDGSVVFDDGAKDPIVETGKENDGIAEPESRETCPTSPSELPT